MVRGKIHCQIIELPNQRPRPQSDRICGRHGHTCQHSTPYRTAKNTKEKTRRMLIFFVDNDSAFNTINRKRLYRILVE
jgi:hypothetical protein